MLNFKKLSLVIGVLSLMAGTAQAEYTYEASADLIYWNARQDGLEYLNYQSIELILNTYSNQMKLKAPNFKWDPGVKLGVKATDACTGYYLGLGWTHLESTAKSSAAESNPDLLYYLLKRDTVQQPLRALDIVDSFQANAKWDLEYNILDLESGVPFQVCSNFILTPFAGIRGAFIHQKFENFSSTLNGQTEFVRDEKIKNDFSGAGLRFGFNMAWELCQGFELIGTTSGSLLYGSFKLSDRVESNAFKTFGNYSYTRYRIASNMEAFLGLKYTKCFCESQQLAIRFGYDLSYWFSQNQIPGQIQPEVTKNTDLSLQGVRLGLDYLF